VDAAMPTNKLNTHTAKRDFKKAAEPSGRDASCQPEPPWFKF
jgi:hypothetical protein